MSEILLLLVEDETLLQIVVEEALTVGFETTFGSFPPPVTRQIAHAFRATTNTPGGDCKVFVH